MAISAMSLWVPVILKTFPHYPLRLLVFLQGLFSAFHVSPPHLRQYDINSIEWWINLFSKEPNHWSAQAVEPGSTDVLSGLLLSTSSSSLQLLHLCLSLTVPASHVVWVDDGIFSLSVLRWFHCKSGSIGSLNCHAWWLAEIALFSSFQWVYCFSGRVPGFVFSGASGSRRTKTCYSVYYPT